jgi:hypothetical protein
MTKRRGIVLTFVVVLGITLSTAAAVPGRINYQGQLNDQNGVPVNATVSLVFSIYDVASGGTALWSETQSIVVSNGVFSVQLGAVVSLPSTLFARDTLYLGIRAGADQEMTPRQQITTSAFSHRAELLSSPIVPVGAIVAWDKSMPGTPALSDGWVECNGQVLSDAQSPYDGQTIPDLNGAAGTARFLRGGTTSGGTGGSESHQHKWAYERYGTYGSHPRFSFNTSSTSYWQQSWAGSNLVDINSRLDFWTDVVDTKPSYYGVVWIMRVK